MLENNEILTLSALNGVVRGVIDECLPGSVWVQAELASVNENRGNCYIELVEKNDGGALLAQARACCWRSAWYGVSRKFVEATGEPLRAGMKALLSVRANFHPAYGFSWIVNDIDPTFTVGDMARRRQEILRTLTEQGVIDLNKQLPISPFCNRIAVISSATAAGYGDFCNQLSYNGYGFAFQTRLFPAIMQGDQAETSIISALNSVNDAMEKENGSGEGVSPFDCVVIIRGGGSITDLSCFDTLALAENVANFSLPVITGIGHDRDRSVLDIVACVSVKTPTAVAEFLISNLAHTLNDIETASQRIADIVRRRLETERMRMAHVERGISSGFSLRRVREESRLVQMWAQLGSFVSQRMEREKNRLLLLEQRAVSADPVNILKKGYTITLRNGKAVRNAKELCAGDEVSIVFADGAADATVCQP